MWSKKIQSATSRAVKVLQSYVERVWYPPLIGVLAALDNFIVVIPNDGILISSSMLTPRRWVALALSIAIGSTVGALVLASLVTSHGLPFILDIYPAIDQTETWMWSLRFFESYGLLLVFAVAVTPFVQQPAVIVAALAETPILQIATVIFAGRVIKYLIMAYIGSHAPSLLNKMRGVQGELREVGIDTAESRKTE